MLPLQGRRGWGRAGKGCCLRLPRWLLPKDSLHPITVQCGMQRPSPVSSALDLSEESPRLQSSPGTHRNCIPGRIPCGLLPNPASFTSFPRKQCTQAALSDCCLENLTFDFLSPGFLSSRDFNQAWHDNSIEGSVQRAWLLHGSYSIITDMQGGTDSSKGSNHCVSHHISKQQTRIFFFPPGKLF